MQVILASQSPYRKEQLKAYGLIFESRKPEVDEEEFKSKSISPRKLAVLLSEEKALSLSGKFNEAVIIGSDQLVSLKGQVLGKPGTKQKAISQLSTMSGRTHELITAVTVYFRGKTYSDFDVAKIKMRKLNRDDIISYVYRDDPLDCAGSYRFEKSGYSLVESIKLEDPSSLMGLPLIKLGKILRGLKEPLKFG